MQQKQNFQTSPISKKFQISILAEIAAIFVIFYLFGAWTVPDSNEPYYIGKAIHFWNPDWIPNDSFFESKDSHWTFYLIFGWLSFFCSPETMAWTGRFLTWGLLAWSWQRLSFALIPVRWMSILSALALAYYVESFNMAGEWILGGVEGKSFAFPFVFLGLEALIRGHWHRVWIFLGIASAFHVLVGGWSALAAAFVRIMIHGTISNIPTKNNLIKRILTNRFPLGLFLGGIISLCGLVPALLLDHGVSKEIVRQAHQIYVFERLYHHLVPYQFPWTYLLRFLLLTLIWILVCRTGQHANQRWKRFEAFIWGTLLLSAIGIIIAYGFRADRIFSAELLRFYWFRLSDIFIPAGIAMGTLRCLLHSLTLAILQFRRNFEIVSVKSSNSNSPDSFESMINISRKFLFEKMLGCMIVLGVPFLVYLIFDAILFGRRIYFQNIPAEPCIPWALTILSCWGFLLLTTHFATGKSSWKLFRLWCFPLLYVVILFYAPFDSLKFLGDIRTCITYSRIEPGKPYVAYYWIDACRWVADTKNTPKTAKFWVPRDGSTFKWHARRSDIGTWKNVPQDAEGIVRWRETMHDLFFYRDENGQLCDDRSLTVLLWWKTDDEIEQLRMKYGFDYILCPLYPDLTQHKNLHTIYENKLYRVYRVGN